MKLAVLLWERHRRPLGNLRLCRELAVAGEKLGWEISVVTPGGLLHSSPREYRWNGTNWVMRPFRGADAVYNRVPHRRFEAQPSFFSALEQLRLWGIPGWNPGFFSKDQVIRSWLARPDLAKRVPGTQLDFEPYQLMSEGDRWLLKPCDGRAGEGIIEVHRVSQNTWAWRWQRRGRVSKDRGSLERCSAFVRRYTRGRHYLAQRQIALATWRGHPFDFRTLWQKDSAGRWRLRGVGARAAGRDRMTTHVPWGGRIAHPHQTLEDSFGTRAEEILDEVLKTAASAVAQLDRSQAGQLGEMSIDLGCDREGNVWLFEANAKPMRFDEPEIHPAYLDGVFETARWAKGHLTGLGESEGANRPPVSGRPAARGVPRSIRD